MTNEFSKVMSERSNEDLIKILTVEKDKYNPDAILAAEFEIKKRNIDSDKFEKTKNQLTTDSEEKTKTSNNVVGSGLRFFNFVIDLIGPIILLFIIAFILQLFISNPEDIILITYPLLYLICFLAYYIIMENTFQKTIGKFVTRTKVVTHNGHKPDLNIIVTRSLCRLIPFDRISFLFVKNGFHDYLSKTTVVKDNAA